MRHLAVALLLASLSLAFAPAPLPKRDRETAAQKQRREVAECVRKLKDMDVKWEVVEGHGGRPVLSFYVLHPSGRARMDSEVYVNDGDLLRALRLVAERSEVFRRRPLNF